MGRMMPSSLVSAGEKVKRIRRRWEMLMRGDVCVGNRPAWLRGRGSDIARWNAYPLVFGFGSGGGGKCFVMGLTGCDRYNQK